MAGAILLCNDNKSNRYRYRCIHMLVLLQEIWRETNKGRQIVSLFFNYDTKKYNYCVL